MRPLYLSIPENSLFMVSPKNPRSVINLSSVPMGKRPHDEDSSSTSSSKLKPCKNPNSSSASSTQANDRNTPHAHQGKKVSTFSSYQDVPNLPPKVKLLCEIIANTPSVSVERVLDDTGIRVSQEDVEGVLKVSYGLTGPAMKFFRWAGAQLRDQHSPYSWNLIVDMLGKNCLFDAMWDAVKSMRAKGLLSLATFASVFGSYAAADRVKEAIMTFEVMGQYGCRQNVVALNSLISAICREGKTQDAKEFVDVAKGRVRFDADSYAILLEGWENERDVSGARQTLAEMVKDIGWDPRNVPAYDSYLCSLLKGPEGMNEALKFFHTLRDRGCFPGLKFFKLAIEDCLRKNDVKTANLIWEVMLKKDGCRPDTEMLNSMISLQCNIKEFDSARKLLDEMVYHGVFLNSETYNLFLHYLLRNRKLKEASPIFSEMVKNEFVPSHSNCSMAVKAFMESGDPYTAIKIWKCMIENYNFDLEETGNLLILGLRGMNRVPEAVKYAENMIDRQIKLTPAAISKLKQSLLQKGKVRAYEELWLKWKA